ncbi:MAG: hypothetical protein KIT22_17980, partial [Verrucomicrobiae bacterium]|nr:hypothetical protein [Verrucomicrobiae bacterium]
ACIPGFREESDIARGCAGRHIGFMFTSTAIRERLISRPFRPFALRTASGAEYPVPHPEFAMVGLSGVEVGLEPDSSGIVNRFVHCSLVNVTELVDLPSKAANGR